MDSATESNERICAHNNTVECQKYSPKFQKVQTILVTGA